MSLDSIETEELLLINISTKDEVIPPRAVRSVLNAKRFHSELFGWQSDEQVTFLLRDVADSGNAAAGPVPRNIVMAEVSPPDKTFESYLPLDQLFALMNHEVAHLATNDAHGAAEQFWRRLFLGKPAQTSAHPETLAYAYLTAPRATSPRWASEGIATFMETWMAGGVGRAQGGFDEMVFRAMVRDGAPFYSNLGVASEGAKVDFNTSTNAYLYGTRFMSYLAYRYSPGQLIEWFRRDPGSRRYYAAQFKQVFGATLEQVWQQWIEFEHNFQARNLEEVRRFPLTRGQRIGTEPVGWVSRMFIDETSNSLVGGLMYPGVVAHLGAVSLADGAETNLHDVKGPMKYSVTSTAWDPVARRLFFTEDQSRKRDLMYLDLPTGEVTRIARNARIGQLVFNRKDRSLWGVRHQGGKVELVGTPYPYQRLKTVYRAPYGQVISDMDISPDGRFLSATVGDIKGRQSLQVFRISDLVRGKFKPAAQFNFGRAYPENFVFSPDGKYLYGSSYFTGVSNIYRFELKNGRMHAVTNAETGFFRPIPQADGSLIVFEYTGAGFVPLRLEDPRPLQHLGTITFFGNEIVKKHPVLATWGVGDPDQIDLEPLIKSREPYNPMRRLEQESAYPIIEGYKEQPALGYSFNWSDRLGLDSLKLDLSYSIDSAVESDERLHVDAQYKHMDWTVRYWRNDANFYDLFGPTERSRKGEAFIVGYDDAVIYDLPRRLDFSADVAYYRDLDTLPVNQNAQELIDQLWSGGFGWNYAHAYGSQGSSEEEKGVRWAVRSDLDYADTTLYPRLYATLDLGFALPVEHASIWVYSAAGAGDGNRDEALTNFYFGGFGNNYVDDNVVRRYRNYDSLPGFEIGQISARQFARSVVEVNAPPIRFAEVGSPGFYLGEIRPAAFAGTLWSEPGTSLDATYSTIGVQFDLSFTALHRQPMTISIGFARGFGSGEDASSEFMLSLKIL